MPDYNFKHDEQSSKDVSEDNSKPAWPAVDTGTSIAGILGSILTLGIVFSIGKGFQYLCKS